MEVILYGHSINVNEPTWESDTHNIRKRVNSIVKKGGILDTIICESNRAGDQDYFRLTQMYLDFELKCQKLVKNLTEEEKVQVLQNIDIDAEFASRYELLGIQNDERVDISLYVIERNLTREEKNILLGENVSQSDPESRFSQLNVYLELIYPKLQHIDNKGTRERLTEEYRNLEKKLSKSSNMEYLASQQKIIRDINAKMVIHYELVALIKKIIFQDDNIDALEFLRTSVLMMQSQRKDMIQKIEKIENEYINSSICGDYYSLGEDLEQIELYVK